MASICPALRVLLLVSEEPISWCSAVPCKQPIISRVKEALIDARNSAAIVWFGTQTYQGGQATQVMLGAIWPSFKTFPNHLPPSAHVTSAQLLCFFIFFIVQLPLLYIHISKLRYLFMVKIVLMPIFGIVMFAWAVSSANGFGPVFNKSTNITNGYTAGAVFLSAMTSAIAPKATLALNVCDFTRELV